MLQGSIRPAEAEGTRGIGLGYLPWDCRHLAVGKIIGTATTAFEHPKPGNIFVDANGSFAHPAYEAGEAAPITAAKSQGIAVLGVANAALTILAGREPCAI